MSCVCMRACVRVCVCICELCSTQVVHIQCQVGHVAFCERFRRLFVYVGVSIHMCACVYVMHVTMCVHACMHKCACLHVRVRPCVSMPCMRWHHPALLCFACKFSLHAGCIFDQKTNGFCGLWLVVRATFLCRLSFLSTHDCPVSSWTKTPQTDVDNLCVLVWC